MKKLLGISLVAVLAATPLMASARDLTETELGHAAAAEGDAAHMATVSYVKGAYREMGAVVNTKQDQIMAGESEVSTSVVQVDDTSVNAAAASDTALMSEKAILTAIEGAVSTADTAMDTRVDALEETVGDSNSGLVKGLAEEISRATTAEGALAQDIADEETRAKGVEAGLAQDIADEETRAKGVEGDKNNLNTTNKTNLVSAINEVNTAVSNLSTTAGNTYQLKSQSTVEQNGNYITAGTGVAANLGALDARAKTNADNISTNAGAIATINNKQIPVVTDWSTGTVSNTKISELVTYVAPVSGE